MKIYITGLPSGYEVEHLARLFYPMAPLTLTPPEPAEDCLWAEKTDTGLRVLVRQGEKSKTLEAPLPLPVEQGGETPEFALASLTYDLLRQWTGIRPPWGKMTGVRPVRLIHDKRAAGWSAEQIDRFFLQRFDCSEQKYEMAKEIADLQEPILRLGSAPKTYSLYIGIPFCPSRCSYCSFVSCNLDRDRKLVQPYVDCLCKEVAEIRVQYAAQKVRGSGAKIVMLTGPSASGKTTSAHCLAKALVQQGTPAQVVSLDNFFKGAAYYPKMPDGTLDYENLETLDLPLIKQCLHQLSETGKTELPIYDFATEQRSAEVEPIDLQGGVCIVEGIHALNPELTGLVPDDQIYRIYAGLREEYCIDGRRVINTQDIRLCRRTLRDAAARGRSPAKTLSMWDRVLDGETRYIKGFKTTADFLLDTSFTYELGLISRLLGEVRRQFTLEGHNAELWDETARRFEQVDPLPLELLPADSMLREFYGSRT